MVARARELGGQLVSVFEAPARAVILHGSGRGDDFVPGVSDLDLLIVVDRPLTDADVAALASAVEAADPAPAAGIDLHVVAADVAAAPSKAPALDLHIGRHPGAALEIQPRVAQEPDLPAELSTAREGLALHGPAPRDVIGAVDPAWLRERSLHWLTTWLTLLDDEEHAVFMVLTACRMWRFAEDGVHVSKAEAGRWALRREPGLTAVRQALRRRAGGEAEPIGADDLRTVLQIARRGVARA